MNIFFLHWDPEQCAQMHCDKHVVKMILEYCQMLSAAWHVMDPQHHLYGDKDGEKDSQTRTLATKKRKRALA